MKKTLFAAIVAAMAFVGCAQKSQSDVQVAEGASVGASDIAFVQVEAVLAQSDLYLNEGKALEERTQKAQQEWARKQQGLQYEMNQLQEKYQKGLITTLDAQKKQESLQRRAANLENTIQQEGSALEEENVVFSNRAQDLMRRAVSQVNADKKYKLIVNASALIDADTTLDITSTVLEAVNRLYAEEKDAE